jgi:DNA polymerase I-like protein with 3'-5' exonuclease and polymerase domains
MEFPLVFPCLTCEIEGIKVDMERLAVVKAEKEQQVNMELAEFQTAIAAPAFNPNSPPQKMNLFKVLGLGHLPNTAKASMLKAQASSPFNNRILSDMVSIIKAAKLVNTYFQPEKFWHGRCYYKINPAGTDTGRLASSESSYWCGLQIQNIPRDDSVKQCLVSDPGYLLCEIDKAQAEARCVGYLAGETALIDLVEGPHDYHSYNAQRFFGVPYETIYSDEFHKTINKELRDLSKRTNHGANYNMGASVMLDTMGPKDVARAKILLKLSGSLREVCQILLDRYAATYPRVKGSWYESIIMQVKLTGRLVNPFGRTRIFFGKPWLDKRALNAAVAHQPQSTSVDAVNIEFYDLWRCQIYGSFYRDGKQIFVDLVNKIRIKAQIHDSLFFQYLKGKSNEWIPQAVRDTIMTTRVKITDPHGVTREMYIPSDIGCGKERWSELK